MIVTTIKRLMEWIMLFLIFFLLTIIFYKFTFIFSDWVNPIKDDNEPMGRSIKVFDMGDSKEISSREQFFNRVKIFYWLGE